MKILITGGSGLVGKNLINYFKINNNYEVIYPNSSELNLLYFNSLKKYLEKENPDVIIHCAGRVGGIQANIQNPYTFLHHNLIIG